MWDMFGDLVVPELGISADVCYQKPARAASVCEVDGWEGFVSSGTVCEAQILCGGTVPVLVFRNHTRANKEWLARAAAVSVGGVLQCAGPEPFLHPTCAWGCVGALQGSPGAMGLS